MIHTVNAPDNYQLFRILLRGADSDGFKVAAPNANVLHLFLVESGLFRHLDPSYEFPPSLGSVVSQRLKLGKKLKIVLTIRDNGDLVESEKPLFELQAEWAQTTEPNTILAKGHDRNDQLVVLNPGDADGYAWLICFQCCYIDRIGGNEYCVVEGRSAEKALENFSNHPFSIATRVNPLHERARRYGTKMVIGETIPGTAIELAQTSWLTVSGLLLPDPDGTAEMEEARYYGNHAHYGVISVRGTDGGQPPYQCQYLRPGVNGLFDPLEYANPRACATCGNDTRIALLEGDQVFCSHACRDTMLGSYVILAFEKGKRVALGPVDGRKNARLLRHQIDDDSPKMQPKLCRLRPPPELTVTEKDMDDDWDEDPEDR